MDTNYYDRPLNFVAEINGNLIVRDERTAGDGLCSVWNREAGWWTFWLDEASARRRAEMYPPRFHLSGQRARRKK